MEKQLVCKYLKHKITARNSQFQNGHWLCSCEPLFHNAGDLVCKVMPTGTRLDIQTIFNAFLRMPAILLKKLPYVYSDGTSIRPDC